MKKLPRPSIKWRKFNRLPWWKRLLTRFDTEYEIATQNKDGTITIEYGYCDKINVPYGIYVDMAGNEVNP